MDVDVTATSSTSPNSRCIIVSVFLRSHAWPLHGPRKGFFTLWRLQCKKSLLEKISLPKKTPIWVSFSSIFRGEPQNVEFAFFESLDCSFGVRFSKGTGADVPDAAMIWPDA